MRQIMMIKAGGVEVLKIQEAGEPQPGKGEVKINVKAAGINFADILARKGIYPDAPKKPCVVGYEVSGLIESVGEDMDSSLVGDPVIAVMRFGGYSEKVITPVSYVIKKPESLSFEQGAAIPVNYLTAYQLLVVMGGLKKNDRLLIHNAGSGVGLAALDLAKHIGAFTYGTASAHKHSFLRERGFENVLDYRMHDWHKETQKMTDGQGFDLIIDPIGGKNTWISYRALARTGRLGLFGLAVAAQTRFSAKLSLVRTVFKMRRFHPVRLMNANKGIFGVNIGHMWDFEEKIRTWLENIIKGVDEGWVKPRVDRVFPLEKVAEAHTYIEERRSIGKVLLVP
ncbi:MAG: zinc-binding dehydrogenase [Candidatus Aminicenantes bacterium]|nr:MAG: zinc-binding dehydrogenase [Candidatus Aminicenantes bacterium]